VCIEDAIIASHLLCIAAALACLALSRQHLTLQPALLRRASAIRSLGRQQRSAGLRIFGTQRLLIVLAACCIAGNPAAAQQARPAPKQTAHQQASTARPVSIRFLVGPGLCGNCYCGSEVQASPGITLLKKPFRDCQQQDPQKYREFRVDANLSSKHWQELQELVDHDRLFVLPDTIGCPGCTDGLGEFLEVKFSDRTRKAIYYPAENTPIDIWALSETLLALEAKLERELPPWWNS
jgi:hypothetical protein